MYLVLSKQPTFLSISLSHISFMVQPAPLIMTAPRPNRPSTSKFGSSPAAEARAMLHVHGQYNSNHPKNRQWRLVWFVASFFLVKFTAYRWAWKTAWAPSTARRRRWPDSSVGRPVWTGRPTAPWCSPSNISPARRPSTATTAGCRTASFYSRSTGSCSRRARRTTWARCRRHPWKTSGTKQQQQKTEGRKTRRGKRREILPRQ